MANMQKAVVDLGSNTFHLLIGEVRNGQNEVLFQRREAVGIGRNGMAQRQILPDALERGLQVLRSFTEDLKLHGVSLNETLVLATSAFRNALNSDEVLMKIWDSTGMMPRVISGDDEASLIFAGVKASGVIREAEPALVMDIGGGSVEFILWNGSEVCWKKSFEIGGLRLAEAFHQQDPLNPAARKSMEEFLLEKLQPLFNAVENFQSLSLTGSSGVFETIADIQKAASRTFSESVYSSAFEEISIIHFEEIFEAVWSRPLEHRLQIPGMPAYRAPLMPAALILTRLVYRQIGAGRMFVSHYALKEGALFG